MYQLRAVQCASQRAGYSRTCNHFKNGVDAHECANENQNILSADEPLDIFRVAETKEQRCRKEQSVQKSGGKARDRRGSGNVHVFARQTENPARKIPGEYSRKNTVNEC